MSVRGCWLGPRRWGRRRDGGPSAKDNGTAVTSLHLQTMGPAGEVSKYKSIHLMPGQDA